MQENDFEKLQKLGERIHSLRKMKKYTLTEICYKNGLEPSTFSRIEQAIVEPKYLTLVKIASAFNMSVSELLDF
ncbi:MAG: helix-turn-helix transcriptional regulator [Brachyspira sp.]|nr:helix-turn-helix transcriptional regulator [Brachyspira sp.]